MSVLFKRIKNWARSITAFRTGDVIPVDGPSGTAKMSKDDLLQVTAQNADEEMSSRYDLESIDFGKEKSVDMTATSGNILVRFDLFELELSIGETYLIKLNESANCVSSFAIGSFGTNGSWTRNSSYVPADGEWHEVTITATNTYDGKCGIYVPQDRVIGNGTVSMEICTKYEETLLYKIAREKDRIEVIEPKVNAASLEEITIETLSTSEKNLTNNTASLEFELISGRLRTGDVYKVRMIDESEKVSSFSLGSFGTNGSWTHNSSYVPADGEWHEVTITADNSYNDKFGWWISQEKIHGDCSVRMEIQINYGTTLMGRVGKNEKSITNLELSALTKQFDGILKTDVSSPLTSISEAGGFASIFDTFCFCGDSVCSGTVAYNDGTWHYPNLYATSWGQYMCRMIGSKGVNLSYSGAQTSTWINSYITLNSTGYDPDNIGSRLLDSPKKAYIIALGINDVSAGVVVGDVDTDIDMDNPENYAHTFAGQYGYIIQKIKEVQPSAKIFVVTIPAIWQSQADSLGYNDVIRDMATKFTNVFVVDFQAYLPTGTKINSDYVYQGHMTTQGYKWITEAMATYIDYIVRTTPQSFKNVALIGHSSDHGQY